MSQASDLISFNIGQTEISILWIPQFIGVGIEILIILVLILLYKFGKNTTFMVLFDDLFEKVHAFFADILGEDKSEWLKNFVTTIFFIILTSNLLELIIEFVAPIFGVNEAGHLALEEYLGVPTTDLNFNIVMAVVGVLVVLFMQLRVHGLGGFIYDFFPIFGKNYIPYNLGNLPAVIDYPLFALVKIFDIILSLFLGLLEIIGTIAKVISLSFRLFGNMTSGATLVVILYGALGGLTMGIVGANLPIVFPIIVYAQELLVSLIQAFVFPLLLAIFVKVATTVEE